MTAAAPESPGLRRWRPAHAHLAEALELLAEAARPEGSDEGIAGLARELRGGGLPETLLWVGGKDEAVALVVPEPAGRSGVHVQAVVLRPEYAVAPVALGVGRALVALAGSVGRELLTVRIVGPPDPAAGLGLEELGLLRVRRTDWRLPEAGAPPEPPALPSPVELRPLSELGVERFAHVHARAYSTNPIDRLLFLDDYDALLDARHLGALLLSDRWAPWLSAASFAAVVGDRPVGAVACHDHDGALLSDVATDPAFRGRGIARALVARAVQALRAAGHRSIRLVVTEGNAPAMRTYRSLGFVADPTRSGDVWCAERALQRLRAQPPPPP